MLDPSVSSTDEMLGAYLDIDLYGTGPIEPVYELTSAAGSTDTQLQVRGLRDYTNPNTETEWAAGCDIAICNLGSADSIVRKTLDSVTPVGDGVLNLSSTLGTTRVQGALVCLINRNITIRTGSAPTDISCCIKGTSRTVLDSILIYSVTSTASRGFGLIYGYYTEVKGTCIIYASSACFLAGYYQNISERSVLIGSTYFGLMTGSGPHWTITGEAVCCGAERVISSTAVSLTAYGFEISGDVIIAGVANGVGSVAGHGIIRGNVRIYGCNTGLNGIEGAELYDVKIYRCTYGLYGVRKARLYNCEIGVETSNTYDIYASGCEAWGTTLGSSTQVSNYTSYMREDALYAAFISWDHNNVKSKYPNAWMPGGDSSTEYILFSYAIRAYRNMSNDI